MFFLVFPNSISNGDVKLLPFFKKTNKVERKIFYPKKCVNCDKKTIQNRVKYKLN